MADELYNSKDYCSLAENYEALQRENIELAADKIHLIQAAMDGGDKYHYTAYDIGYRDMQNKCKALEADYTISNRELLIKQAEIARLTADLTAERERNRWIPVGERLPEVLHRWLLCTKDKIFIGSHLQDAPMWLDDAGNLLDENQVTHWRPIVPPEVEK